MKLNNKRFIYWTKIVLAFYWFLLFIGTSLPSSMESGITYNDKVVHFLAYGGLAFLVSITLSIQNRNMVVRKYFYLFTLIIVIFYGVIDEVHQSFIPGRSMDPYDLLADSLGCIAGIIIAFPFIKKIFLPLSVDEKAI